MSKRIEIVVAVVLAAVLIVLFGFSYRQEQLRKEHLAALQKEAEPLEEELDFIEEDLKEREKEINDKMETSSIIPGFLPTSEQDIPVIEELVQGDDYTPVLILDCSMEMEEQKRILEKIKNKKYDIVLTGMEMNEKVWEQVGTIRDLLPAYGYDQNVNFLLRKSYDTPENLLKLQSLGFQSFSRYSDSIQNGVTDAGIPYLAYRFVRLYESGVGSINELVKAKAYMVLVFDFETIGKGTMTKKDVSNLLAYIQKLTEEDKLWYCDIREASEEQKKGEESSTARKNEYEAYEAAQQERIEELEEEIREIYSRWKE